MRRLFFLLPLYCLVAACASTGTGRVPESTSVAIVWNRTDDTRRACEALSDGKEIFNILGCARWEDGKPVVVASASSGASAPVPLAASSARVCTIYAPEPRDERDLQRMATLGHELMHCFEGNWHDAYGNK